MKKTLIIAEAGVNHNGSLELAKKLIDVAAEAGVDYVKFQTFKAEKLVAKDAKKAAYQLKNIGGTDDSQFNMLKKLELDREDHLALVEYCKQKKIGFLSSPFDLESIDLLEELGIDIYKIPSGEINNFPFLRKVGSKGKPIILSTGMADMGEIEDALEIFWEMGVGRNMLTVLHCNTEYPTPMRDVNLKAMLSIKNGLKINVGYSDHTLGIEVPIAAVAMGAKCIEKHFTLNKNMEGPDHKASLDPIELKDMVKAIRNIEIAMGTGIKRPSSSEVKNKLNGRKSIYLSKNLKKGDILTNEDLIVKRPGDGISPIYFYDIIGTTLIRDVAADAKLTFHDILRK